MTTVSENGITTRTLFEFSWRVEKVEFKNLSDKGIPSILRMKTKVKWNV